MRDAVSLRDNGLSIHFGHFLTRKVNRRLARPPRSGSPNRIVWNTEEKGSDVNLASYLLIDGFRARYDIAVVISNDSDLKTPVEFVRGELEAPVGILNPQQEQKLGAFAEEAAGRFLLQADPFCGSGGFPVAADAQRRRRHDPQAQRLVKAP